jgi:hypothetical protein
MAAGVGVRFRWICYGFIRSHIVAVRAWHRIKDTPLATLAHNDFNQRNRFSAERPGA